jgi:hypothetical protein
MLLVPRHIQGEKRECTISFRTIVLACAFVAMLNLLEISNEHVQQILKSFQMSAIQNDVTSATRDANDLLEADLHALNKTVETLRLPQEQLQVSMNSPKKLGLADGGERAMPKTQNIKLQQYGNAMKNNLPNVMIEMKYQRQDRLGSNIRRPLSLLGYAHCLGYGFCIRPGSEGITRYFSPGFPTCPNDLQDTHPPIGRLFYDEINQTGLYTLDRDDDLLRNWVHQNGDCGFDDSFRALWRQMIVNASNSPFLPADKSELAKQQLFQNKDDAQVTTVAVHIRRGDYVEWGRGVIHDVFYVVMLRRLRARLEKMKRIPEIHIFSEDYGWVDKTRNLTSNWTLYEGIADHIHLAPDMRTNRTAHAMDMALNLRDWRHFVEADILIVGSPFSEIPALGRPKHPDLRTGLPLTLYPCGGTVGKCSANPFDSSKAFYYYGWSQYDYGWMPDKQYLFNLPEFWENLYNSSTPEEDDKDWGDLLQNWNATQNNRGR